MGYRTDNEPVFKPEFRSGIETTARGGMRFVIAQRHIDSPHELVWESTPFPSPDAARRWLLEQEAMLAVSELRDPITVCSNLSHIAFHIHWARVAQEGHPSTALADCSECYKTAEEFVRAAAEELEELDWIKEVHRVGTGGRARASTSTCDVVDHAGRITPTKEKPNMTIAETTTDPLEAAKRCLAAAELEEDGARMGRLIELAYAWLNVRDKESLS